MDSVIGDVCRKCIFFLEIVIVMIDWSSNFVNYLYDYKPNWTALLPLSINDGDNYDNHE